MAKELTDWCRITGAALDCKAALARLVPRLDAAIAAGDPSVLPEVRALAVRHATALQMAIKHPAPVQRPRPARVMKGAA